MRLTRRNAIQLTSLTALGAALSARLPAAGLAAGAESRFADQDLISATSYTAASFEPWIGASFKVLAPAASLKLIEANDLGTSSPAAQTKSTSKVNLRGFSLRFRGTGARLTQGTYLLSNPSFGNFSVFLVPSSRNSSPTYSAIFLSL